MGDIVDFFDPTNAQHLRAYVQRCDDRTWPAVYQNAVDNGSLDPARPMWYYALHRKCAHQYIFEKLGITLPWE